MRFELPQSIKNTLASRNVRLHHLLWHAIRDSWHLFSEEQREFMRENHPNWVPNIQRFNLIEPPSPTNPRGVSEINYEAGESFLYMHRRMIHSVNLQLIALGEAAISPWDNLPSLDDPDYPVPGRIETPAGASEEERRLLLREPKSDEFYHELVRRMELITRESILSNPDNSLALIGAWVESNIHDFMHMRWTASPGIMEEFPPFSPLNVNPTIDSRFDDVGVDYLGSPWSSHVNSIFWKLHGWVDQVIDKWRVAQGLENAIWADTWSGHFPEEHSEHHGPEGFNAASLSRMHDHFSHGHHSSDEMMKVFKTINGFEGCFASFSYIMEQEINPLELE